MSLAPVDREHAADAHSFLHTGSQTSFSCSISQSWFQSYHLLLGLASTHLFQALKTLPGSP